eukprot:390665-Rhodomonas_salina.2
MAAVNTGHWYKHGRCQYWTLAQAWALSVLDPGTSIADVSTGPWYKHSPCQYWTRAPAWPFN